MKDKKEIITELLKQALKQKGITLKKEDIFEKIEIPPSNDFGDYSFPCYFLAKEFKLPPEKIALDLKEKVSSSSLTDFENIETKGPYINFFINRKKFSKQIINKIKKEKYKESKSGKSKLKGRNKLVIEFSSPNIAKPLGIGHLRSTIVGNSLANIAEFIGFRVVKINWLGDWGTQFGKLIYGFEKFGDQKKLKNQPIKHLLDLYIKVSKNKTNEEKARQEFKRLEEGKKEYLQMWKEFRELTLNDLKRVYEILGVEFDEYTGESKNIKDISKVLKELKEKNLVKKSQGALIVDLKKYDLGVVLIQKKDGTTLYITRDIAEAKRRYEKYKFSEMIYEVGEEQKLHFQQLFKILELMGYEWAKNCKHVGHGFYLDKDGKKFATRKGKSYFVEDIFNETVELAKKEISSRFPHLSKKKLEERAKVVAKAAIFYGDLKNTRTNNIVFDLRRFVSFEGNTGPYILYSYARASSILKKAKKPNSNFEIKDLDQKEYALIKKLSEFDKKVLEAHKTSNPTIIANYSYELAQLFNEFYHKCPVVNSEQEKFRLALVDSFREVIKNSFSLLGIPVLEEM